MQLHPQTAFAVVGFLYVALPIVAWTILHDRHSRTAVALWCLGTIAYGAAFVLVGLRGLIADWVSYDVANPLGFAAWALLGAALRRELQLPEHIGRTVAIWFLASLAFVLLHESMSIAGPRILYVSAVYLAGSLWVVRLAWRLYRRSGFRSAALLAGAYATFAIALVIRCAGIAWHWRTAEALTPSFDFAITFVSSLVAALYGNLGYIGIALESSQKRDMATSVELAREHERRQQSEVFMIEQAALLEERGRLLVERGELLTALAHEVRQPLNNASAALQGAEAVLSGSSQSRDAMSAGLRRAATVLNHVAAAVDNTLADAVLLGSREPLEMQDSDVDTLLQLVLGDMPLDERARVRIVRDSATRTASMHPGLMRLALRNLLANALKYSPSGRAVRLRIADSDEPLALVIDVVDEGPGLSPELLPRLFLRGARGQEAQHRQGHGLGLYLVRRIMEQHGGSVEALRTGPDGTTFRLVIPQG